MKKLIFLLLAALSGWFFWPQISSLRNAQTRENPQTVTPSSRGSKKGDLPAVPVVVTEVKQQDVPLYLNGLGTVQGYNTVTVRSRVDGHIDRILFTEGQDVKAGDILAQIDSRPFQSVLDQALAKKRQDEALLENARLDLKRDKTLLQEKAGTAQKADTQQALVTQLEAGLTADDAAIESARVQLEYTTLRSPIDGRTGIRIVDEGNVVRSGDVNGIVSVTQLRPISIVFTLSEQHLPAIQAEMREAELPVIAMGRDNTTQIAQGVLSVIDNQIDTTTGTIRLKATFKNDNLILWPGQFVNVRLQLSIAKGAIVVPAAVVQRGPMGTFAYAVKSDETVELRPLSVSQIEDGLAILQKGLSPGDKVVVDGQYRLQPGSRIKVIEGSGARPEGEKKLP